LRHVEARRLALKVKLACRQRRVAGVYGDAAERDDEQPHPQGRGRAAGARFGPEHGFEFWLHRLFPLRLLSAFAEEYAASSLAVPRSAARQAADSGWSASSAATCL